MFGIIIAVALIIAGFVAAKLSKKGWIIGVAAVLAVAVVGMSCFVSVPAGHTGVVTTFGRVENYTLDSGAHFVAPWRTVINMDNRVQKKNLELPCFSSDIQEVHMSYTVNYQISKADAMTLYSTVGQSYYDTVIAPNIAESVKVATAKYTAEQLVSMRDSLAVEIESILESKLNSYNIVLVGTSIENMDFTDVFTNAVEAKQVAQQNKLRAQTEAEQKVIESEAAAEVRKINADAEAYELLKKAEAEAEANRKISESLTENLIDYTYANSWNGELPKIISGSDGSVIVNAADLIKSSGNNE
ncbi:MAG: prohibitin family protein [Oscillospiraceae bacterium]|nr:prohibitin family protein [Oscillospiraceae bacterium]